MAKISPSILSADFGDLKKEVAAVEAAGADYLHVDVMDGHFVPNITIGPFVVEALKKITKLPLDVHLMIEDPDKYIPAFAKAGSSILTVHVEASTHLHRTIQLIKELGVKAGVTLNPSTPAESIGEVIGDVDLVLVMSVNPGFSGQGFIEASIPKLQKIRKMLDAVSSRAELEIDGGIKPSNIARVAKAGADVFVAGSAIFGSSDYKKTIAEMRSAIAGK
ncbi:MAG: ribulose-phosphate 3-epimerase [Deltaproteobacteria bacterium]|nr:ribulose-phosphate 3-epimerase [Deltaproteobacteria bacterium]